MSHLSDKELLEALADFPKHELTTVQRTEMLKKISKAGSHKPKRTIHFQKIGTIAAVLTLILIAPILYFTNTEEQLPRMGSTNTVTQEADYFALIDNNGKPLYGDSNYGIPNKVSLLAPKEWVAQDYRSVSKIMVFLWGKEFDLNQTLNIDAVNVKTGQKQHLEQTSLSSGLYGADAHALASFAPLYEPGLWNLEFTLINNKGEKKKAGEFAIYVKEPYVTIGKSTLLISQEDLFAGLYEETFIEVEGDQLPPEIELEIFSVETGETSTFTFKDKTDYTTTEGKNISKYKGDFQLKKSGEYRFTVLQQSQPVEVRKPISN